MEADSPFIEMVDRRMNQGSFRPTSLRIRRHEPEILESLDEQNQKLLDAIRIEIHEVNGETHAVMVCPMGASGRKKKSFWGGHQRHFAKFQALVNASPRKTGPD